jgi:hypothetical protein
LFCKQMFSPDISIQYRLQCWSIVSRNLKLSVNEWTM